MIKNVECVRAEVQVDTVGQREFTGHRSIDLGQAVSDNVTSGLGPLLTGSRNAECERIQPLSSGLYRIVDPHRLPGYKISPWIRSSYIRSQHSSVKRESAAGDGLRFDRPSRGKHFQHSLMLRARKSINNGSRKRMAHIKCRRRIIAG